MVVRLRKRQFVVREGTRRRRQVNRSMIVAVWITDGEERCVVGSLPSKYDHLADDLDGRIAMVVDMLSLSNTQAKRTYSLQRTGACYIRLIDRDIAPDESHLQDLLSYIESDTDSVNS